MPLVPQHPEAHVAGQDGQEAQSERSPAHRPAVSVAPEAPRSTNRRSARRRNPLEEQSSVKAMVRATAIERSSVMLGFAGHG